MSWKIRGIPMLQPLKASVNLDRIGKDQADQFFKVLAKQGEIRVKLFAMNRLLGSRRAYLREDLENPSARTGKENFFEIISYFPATMGKRAVTAELVVQGTQLALSPISEVSRIEGTRMVISWRIKLK
jgi:hypothetical protein